MTGENQKLLTTIPFSGFYESIHDMAIDNAIEREFDVDGDGEPDCLPDHIDMGDIIRDMDMRRLLNDYARAYVDFINEHFDLPSLEFESLQSPREYNFTTDRIFAYISVQDIAKMYAAIPRDRFAEWIEEQFTSCPGFISFYSNSLTEWLKQSGQWDHNQIGTLMQAYVTYEDGDKLSDCNYEMEFLDWHGLDEDIHNYIPEKYAQYIDQAFELENQRA
jgi:hypothetical protein